MFLRVCEVEVGEKLGIGQVEQAGRVVCQFVGRAGDVSEDVMVTVLPLVQACVSEQVGSRARGGGGVFRLPADRWDVVAQSGEGAMAAVELVHRDGGLAQGTGKLQITIGDGALGVVEGDEVLFDIWGESLAPEDRRVVWLVFGRNGGGEPNAAHANFGSVAGPDEGGFLRNNFGKVGGAVGEVIGQDPKVLELVPGGLVDLNAGADGAGEGTLKLGEEPGSTGDAEDHTADFSQKFLHGCLAEAALPKDRLEDEEKALDAMGGQLDGTPQGVDEPAQDGLGCAPASVAFAELGEGDGFAAVPRVIGLIIRPEHHVVAVKEHPPDAIKVGGVALRRQ
jgi:hypothetical protein